MSNLMVVTHNLQSMFAQRNLGSVSTRKKKSTEKLSSGYKINRAADDAAGLTISEKMRSLVRGLSQGVENTQDGISMCQIADGALEEVHDMLHRITELSVKASNGTNTAEDRQAIQSEINSLLAEIDRVSESTEFNTMPIFKIGPDIEPYSKEEIDISDEEIMNQLINGTFTTIAGNIEVDGKTVLTADEANGLMHMLSIAAYGKQIYDNPFPFTKENADKIAAFFDNVLDNMAYFSKWDSQSPPRTTSEFFADTKSIVRDFIENFPFGGSLYERSRSMKFDMGYGEMVYPTEIFKEIVNDIEGRFYADRYYGGDYTEVSPGNAMCAVCSSYLTYLGKEDSEMYELAIDENYFPDLFRYIYNHEGESNPNGVWIQSGAKSGDGMYIQFGRIDTGRLGIKGIDASTESGARDAIESSKNAVNKVSNLRSHIGAQQNRLEHTVANENNIVENTQAAESRIRDTDMPAEMVRNAKENILEQVGHSVLAQANQSTQGVLTLLNR